MFCLQKFLAIVMNPAAFSRSVHDGWHLFSDEIEIKRWLVQQTCHYLISRAKQYGAWILFCRMSGCLGTLCTVDMELIIYAFGVLSTVLAALLLSRYYAQKLFLS